MAIDDNIQRIAEALDLAEQTATPISPIRGDLAARGTQPYLVQRCLVERSTSRGLRVVGRKIGLTSKSVQQQLGVDQPDYGVIFSDRIHGDNATLDPTRFISPRVEAEVAFMLVDDIETPEPTWSDVLHATAYVLPAIEVVDSRVIDWDIQFDDTVADNASFGACILGGPARRIEGLDLSGAEMTLTANGKPASSGVGAACLGNPINAVVWLAKTLNAHGEKLTAGDIILSGALGAMVPAQAGTTYRAEIAGLGHVSFSYGESDD